MYHIYNLADERVSEEPFETQALAVRDLLRRPQFVPYFIKAADGEIRIIVMAGSLYYINRAMTRKVAGAQR